MASDLSLEFLVPVLKYTHQRAGPELLGHRSHILQTLRLAERAHKPPALHPRAPKMLHLERMMAQETRLKASRRTRTVFATGPVSLTRSRISPPITKANQYGFNIG